MRTANFASGDFLRRQHAPVDHIHRMLEYIAEGLPNFFFQDNVLWDLGLRRLHFMANYDNRGMASIDGDLWLNTTELLRRVKPCLPYSAPCGKADTSPLGVFAHELGHLAHFCVIDGRHDPEFRAVNTSFKQLFQTNRKNAITSYARTRWSEDVAEAHRLWVTNPDKLYDLSPERHANWKLAYELMFGAKFARLVKAPIVPLNKRILVLSSFL